MRKTLIVISAMLLIGGSGAIAAEKAQPRRDGCIGASCGKDSTPKEPTPRKDGCIGPNCGKDSAPKEPTPRKDGCIGLSCGKDK